MKKFFVLLFLSIFLISIVSASILTTHQYSENDMKVEFQTAYLFDKGYIELKSHSSVNQILEVGYGKEEVVMYYDFNWNSLEEDGLGKVSFTNISNGEIIEKNYTFVRWENVSYQEPIYKEDCILNGTNQSCSYIVESYKEVFKEEWVDYPSNDIPSRESRIGLKTYVGQGDYIDAVWTIAGDRVERHAEWTASLNVLILNYYKFDEENTNGTGTIFDSLGLFNLTNAGADNTSGQINTAYEYIVANTDWISGSGLTTQTDMAFSFWAFSNDWDTTNWASFVHFGDGTDTADRGIQFNSQKDTGEGQLLIWGGGSALTITGASGLVDGTWNHFVGTKEGTNYTLYINTVLEGSGIKTINTFSSPVLFIGALGSAAEHFGGKVDELGIWNRTLSQAEVTQLYNGGVGISWTDVFPVLPNVTVNAPVDEFNSTLNDILLNCTISDGIQLDNVTFYVDGIAEFTNTSGVNNSNYIYIHTFSEGTSSWKCGGINNASQGVNSSARNVNVDSVPVINVISPPFNDTTFTTSTIFFNASTSLPIDTWIVNYNGTNVTLSSINSSLTVEDGNYHLFLYGNNSISGVWGLNSSVWFNVDTTPFIVFLTPPTLVNNSNITQEFVPMNVNVSTDVFANITYSLRNINGTNFTQFFPNETFDINFTNLPDGIYNYDVEVCTTTDQCNSTETRVVNHDTIAPLINLTSPVGSQGIFEVTKNLTINYSVVDSLNSTDTCLYEIGGVNSTLNCSETSLEIVVTNSSLENLTVYANDTFGNSNSNTTTWFYPIIINSNTFSNTTIEGKSEDFILNLTLDPLLDLSAATLIYNGTENIAAIASSGQIRIVGVTSFTIPDFVNNTNVTFYWIFNMSDSSQLISNNYTQEVSAISIDNCSTNTIALFNLSLFDEEAKTPLLGNIEIFYEVLNMPDFDSIFNLSTEVLNFSNAGICANINLTDGTFAYSVEIRYYAEDYATELYHIQKTNITVDPVNLSLFDLLLNDSTEFLIKYQNEDLVKVEGAIIQLQRKYISEDLYEVVEAPLTGNEGTAVVHVDLDTNKYRATVVKDGEVLDIFLDIVFHCENELSGQCEQKLYAALNPLNEIPLETINDFSYTISELGNETLDIIFAIPSGVPASINIMLSQTDQFGNETLCNTSVVSSAGSVQCTFDRTIGDSFLELTILKAGELVAQQNYVIFDDTANDFLGNNLILVFIFLLSLGGMAMSSPEWIIINGIVALVLTGLLWLVNGVGIVEGLGMVAYLVIAAVILIMKIAKQEDQ